MTDVPDPVGKRAHDVHVTGPGRTSRAAQLTVGKAGWQNRPHDGLRHPFNPDQAASPNDAYAALVAAAGYVPVSLTGEDYIELLPADWRAITDAGIQIELPHLQLP